MTSPRELPNQVYLLKIESNKSDNPIYKIGVSTIVAKRITALNAVDIPSSNVRGRGIINTITLLATSKYYSYEKAYRIEKELHKVFSCKKYQGVPVLANGNSELFTFGCPLLFWYWIAELE